MYIFTFPSTIRPSTSRLRALNAAAERTTPLQSVGVAVQSVVLDAGQLGAACMKLVSLGDLDVDRDVWETYSC
jgi:hypothetical protein